MLDLVDGSNAEQETALPGSFWRLGFSSPVRLDEIAKALGKAKKVEKKPANANTTKSSSAKGKGKGKGEARKMSAPATSVYDAIAIRDGVEALGLTRSD